MSSTRRVVALLALGLSAAAASPAIREGDTTTKSDLTITALTAQPRIAAPKHAITLRKLLQR